MPGEIFVCNGFAFDVFAILTPSMVDSDECFHNGRHLWTSIPVGNVLPAPLSTADAVELFSVDNMVPVENSSQERPAVEMKEPPRNDGAYLSMYYVNLEGVASKLEDNYVAQEGTVYILSLSADIHRSSPDDHWTDLNGNSHKPLPCEECNRCQKIESSLAACSSCFYVANISTLQSAMRCVLDVGVSDMLVKLANDLYIEPAAKGYEQTQEIKDKLKDKAKKYALIESEARRFVAMTKEYGERVQEAFEEYKEEEDFGDFAAAAENTSGLLRKFEEVTNKHAELINEVDVLKNEADEGRREMSNRADNIRDREIFQRGAAVTGSTTVGSGLLAAGVRGVPVLSEVGAPALARVVGVVGRAGAVGLAVAGSATLIGLLGYGGYQLFKKLKKDARTNFAYLAQSFDEISRGIENVSRHLGLIEDSLRNIESKWRKIIDEDGKIVGAGVRRTASSTANMVVDDAPSDALTTSPSMEIKEIMTRKERRLAGNIVKKVKELMEACDGYERRTSGSRAKLSLPWKSVTWGGLVNRMKL